MFTLKIHTVDSPERLHTTVIPTTTTSSTNNINGLKPVQLMGVAHLFRKLPRDPAAAAVSTIASVINRTTIVFIVAVPNYMSSDDFLMFCESELSHFQDILFLRNDGMEDRYSVLIRLEDRFSADGFYCSFNGKKFKPSEVEVCHMYFSQAVEYTDSAEYASTPPPDFTELPSCPVCIERLDPDTSGIQSTLCDHSFQCSCVSKWTFLSCSVCRLCQQQEEKPACAECGTLKNLWICLICGFVGCGRYEKAHASGHWKDKHHNFSLEWEKQQIWDYVGDKYVHRLNQSKIDGKAAMSNSRWSSDKQCGTCEDDEEGLNGALFGSKIEVILDEYNHLLASQLESQRQHYESLIAEVKSTKESSIAKAVDKAIFSKTHDLQDKLEKYTDETKAVANRNKELMKKQEFLQNKFKEIEERLLDIEKTVSTMVKIRHCKLGHHLLTHIITKKWNNYSEARLLVNMSALSLIHKTNKPGRIDCLTRRITKRLSEDTLCGFKLEEVVAKVAKIRIRFSFFLKYIKKDGVYFDTFNKHVNISR